MTKNVTKKTPTQKKTVKKSPATKKTPKQKAAPKKKAAKKATKKYWVKKVQETSAAMQLPEGIFTHSSKRIAQELHDAVMASKSTKGTKFQSAMSMLNFYINRAGKNLPAKDKARLERAKVELRKLFGKE